MHAGLKSQISIKIAAVDLLIQRIGNPFPLGQVFIWGDVPAKLKSGRTRYYRSIISCVQTDDLESCLEICRNSGIKNVSYSFN